MHRKSVSEGSGAAVRIGTSGGADFLATWGALRIGIFDVFGSFGSREASGRVETIDWDRGIARKRASEGSGALA